jgi:hypothetical protein
VSDEPTPAEVVRVSRTAQGLPERVTDPEALAAIAAVIRSVLGAPSS